VELGIHQLANGAGNILGCEWRAVGEEDVVAQCKRDRAAIFAQFPCGRQFRLGHLCLAVDANQDAAGQVPNGLRCVVGHKQRIERLRFRAKTETQLAA
jgi:hypothetical protein